jgi:hypothetical protein
MKVNEGQKSENILWREETKWHTCRNQSASRSTAAWKTAKRENKSPSR